MMIQEKPKTGDPHEKAVNGNTYNWCLKHKAWTLHKPSKCRLEGSSKMRHGEQGEGEGLLRLNMAMMGVVDSNEESDSDKDE
jgi:hypothetical protein